MNMYSHLQYQDIYSDRNEEKLFGIKEGSGCIYLKIIFAIVIIAKHCSVLRRTFVNLRT